MKVEVVQANAEPLLVGRVGLLHRLGDEPALPHRAGDRQARRDAAPPGQNLEGDALRRLGHPELLRRHLRHRQDHPRRIPTSSEALRARRRARHAVHPRPPRRRRCRWWPRFPDQVEKADKLAWRWKIQNRAVHQRGHQEERPPLDEPDGLGRDDGLLPGVRPDPARRPRR